MARHAWLSHAPPAAVEHVLSRMLCCRSSLEAGASKPRILVCAHSNAAADELLQASLLWVLPAVSHVHVSHAPACSCRMQPVVALQSQS